MGKGSHRGPLHAADVYGAASPAAPTAPGEEPSPALPGAAPSCGPGRGEGSGEGLRVSRPRSDGGKTMIMMHVGQLGESGFCSVLSRGCTHLAAISLVPVVRPAGSGGADLERLDPRQRRARGMVTPAGRGLEHSKGVAKAPRAQSTVRPPVPAISAVLPSHREWSEPNWLMAHHRETFSVLSPIDSGLGLTASAQVPRRAGWLQPGSTTGSLSSALPCAWP